VISLHMALVLLLCHFIGDFVMQTDEVAKAKSTDNGVLAKHVLIYMLPFVFLFLVTWNHHPGIVALFLVYNAGLHFITDYVSSRMTTKAWKEERRHDFFVIIGADQFVHAFCLLSTYVLFSSLKV